MTQYEVYWKDKGCPVEFLESFGTIQKAKDFVSSQVVGGSYMIRESRVIFNGSRAAVQNLDTEK